MENQQDSFFDVRLDHNGIAQLKRLSVTTRWLFVFGMLLNLLLLINALLRYSFVNPERFASNLPLYLEVRLQIWYVLLYCILFTFQLRFYLGFVRQAHKGGEIVDTLIGSLDIWANFNMSKMIMHR